MKAQRHILFIYFVLLVFVISSLVSCNITYVVRNQHNELEEMLYFPCGKVTMELIGKGNSKFVFKQFFESSEGIVVHSDSLRIFYNEKQIEPIYGLKKGLAPHKEAVEILGKKVLETAFEFEKGVFEGDTIRIYGPGYVHCNGQVINLDTVVYSFVNNIRIYGVNYF